MSRSTQSRSRQEKQDFQRNFPLPLSGKRTRPLELLSTTVPSRLSGLLWLVQFSSSLPVGRSGGRDERKGLSSEKNSADLSSLPPSLLFFPLALLPYFKITRLKTTFTRRLVYTTRSPSIGGSAVQAKLTTKDRAKLTSLSAPSLPCLSSSSDSSTASLLDKLSPGASLEPTLLRPSSSTTDSTLLRPNPFSRSSLLSLSLRLRRKLVLTCLPILFLVCSYFALFAVYTPYTVYRYGFKGWGQLLYKDGWK